MNVFNQIHYKKTAKIVGVLSTSRLLTFSHLSTHFCCIYNLHRLARGQCTIKFFKFFTLYVVYVT